MHTRIHTTLLVSITSTIIVSKAAAGLTWQSTGQAPAGYLAPAAPRGGLPVTSTLARSLTASPFACQLVGVLRQRWHVVRMNPALPLHAACG